MNILFIGGSLLSDDFRLRLKKKGITYSNAAETFVSALLNGLCGLSKVRVVTEFFVPAYPKYDEYNIKGERFGHVSRAEVTSIPYLNIPVFQRLSKTWSFYREIKKQLKEKCDVVIIYEVTSRTLVSTLLANKNKKVILIVPDLPEFMSNNQSALYKAAKKIDQIIIDYCLKKINGFVLFSPYMSNKIDIGNRPSITIEGIFNPMDIVASERKNDKRVILYTGKIEKWFGLEDLFEAFLRVKEDCELWLCGTGDEGMINEYTSKDHRIKYLGSKTHQEVIKLQKQAYLLVNPRHSTEQFSMYSFPSKTMEYMASGTATLMCKLKSLPEDYYSHLFLFEDESIEGMAKTIDSILQMDPVILEQKGAKAAEFIVNNKNSKTQATKLLDFINTEVL